VTTSNFQLRKDQLADVERFLSDDGQDGAGLNASQVGAGKTAVAVEAARRAAYSGVKMIIAPLNTRDGWERTIRLLSDEPMRWLRKDDPSIVDCINGRQGWYFGGWEFMRQYGLDEVPIDFLILDEVHRAQNRKSASFVMARDAARGVQRRGGMRMALSATPYGNRPSGAFGVSHILWPHRKDLAFTHYWPFVDRYMGKHINQWSGMAEANDREYTPGEIASVMPLYWRHEQGFPCCINHPNGLQEDLPERVIHRVKVSLSASQRKLYDELQANMFAWIEDNDYPVEAGFPVVMATRLRQIALAVPRTEMAKRIKVDAQTGERSTVDYVTLKYDPETKGSKLDAVQDIVSDFQPGERCVIFTHSAGIITPILHRLSKMHIEAARWDGSVPQAERQRTKDSFIQGSPQNGGNGEGVQVIVAQIGAIGEGVDGLQWACSNEIWYSMDSNNLLNIQAAGRVRRDGQKTVTNAWSLEAEDTIEQDQLASLDRQTRIMTTALRG